MDIAETLITHAPMIESHETGCLKISGHEYHNPIILGSQNVSELPNNLLPHDLNETSFQAAINDKAEVIIIGTGKTQQFLHPKINAALAAQGIGLECMNTASACRTIMMLQSEGRNVWAWLWI